MKHRISVARWIVLGLMLLPQPALAAFHIMDIDQVIGGVGGDTTAQAVQLRMRQTLQNNLHGLGALRVYDAAGLNPVVLTIFPMPPPNPASGSCTPILISTAAFNAKTNPATVPDYAMDNPIPPAYLAAGSLAFESLSGSPPTTYWRVTWGDGGYTGSQGVAGAVNFTSTSASPAFGSALPSSGTQALKFTPAACPLGTNNAADYAVTAGAAVFNNNTGAGGGSFTVQLPPPPVPGLPGISRYLLPGILGLGVLAFAIQRRRRSV
ncbi:MAG: hypothetical protein ACHQ6T_18830 [Myxococcota bacterium]